MEGSICRSMCRMTWPLSLLECAVSSLFLKTCPGYCLSPYVPICANEGASSLPFPLLRSGTLQVRIVEGDKHLSNIIMFRAIHRILRSLGRPLFLLPQHPLLPRYPAGNQKVLEEVHHLEQAAEDPASVKDKCNFTIWSLTF